MRWCRSCGADVHEDAAARCQACQESLDPPTAPEVPVGFVFRIRGKLRVTKRLAICTGVSDQTVELHVSASEPAITTPLADLGEPIALAASITLSPPARLLHAAREPGGPIEKATFDADRLGELAGQWAARTKGTMRRLVEDALALGWNDVVEWAPLTDSEKAWRRAHEAAAYGDVGALFVHLTDLPPAGYAQRVGLVLPYLPALLRDRGKWLPVIDGWVTAGLPKATLVRDLIGPAWDRSLSAGVDLLAGAGREARSQEWATELAALTDGSTTRTLVADAPSWTALAAYGRGHAGLDLTEETAALVAAPIPIIDELIDAGRLRPSADLSAFPPPVRTYLTARLRPEDLDDDAIRAVGHDVELARRRYLARDRGALEAIPRQPGVVHYHALFDVLDGKPPDPERLRPDAAELLAMAARTSKLIEESGTASLPAPIRQDRSLWTLFAGQARAGKLAVSIEDRDRSPALGQWSDLQRLVGLIWEGRWRDASTLGEKLVSTLEVERLQDEALNLTAYALDQLGDSERALRQLQRAMEGAYTEALLINTSIVATKVDPVMAEATLARIVQEAPTHELRAAAMRRAIDLWHATEEMPELPSVLVPSLTAVLSSPCSFEDYVFFIRVASNVMPRTVVELPDPGDDRSGPHRAYRAWARLQVDDNFTLVHLAKELVALHRSEGGASWFMSEWRDILEGVRSSIFVDFGNAVLSGMFIDTINMEDPDLFDDLDRFLLVPQAGAHLAADFAKTDDVLSESAFKKFFYLPIEQFLAKRQTFAPGASGFIAENFSMTLTFAALNYLQAMRNSLAKDYNADVARLRWDSNNRFRLLQSMRQNLDKSSECINNGNRMLDRINRLGSESAEMRSRSQALSDAITEWANETISLRANL
jgi:hypothetical protein